MDVAVVSIGNEILNGSILDTNSNYIAKNLELLGLNVSTIAAVGDSIKQIEDTFKHLSKNYDLVITTGGLGPTFDDNTTQGLASCANVELKLNKKIYQDVIKKVKKKGVKLKLSHLRQTYLPKGCETIPNEFGTACGIMIKINRAYFISMPGVPSEMKPMFENYVIVKIKKLFNIKEHLRYDLKLVGVPESDMDEFLKTVDTDGVDIILNAQEGELAVRLFSDDKNRIESTKELICGRFRNLTYSDSDESIEDVVDRVLRQKGLKLGIIESFSGGYLTLLMSDKESFLGSIVVKNEDLNNFTKFKDADIVIFPSSLNKNTFAANIYHKNELKQIHSRYMGNRNFMKKSVAKRMLGHLYEFLNS